MSLVGAASLAEKRDKGKDSNKRNKQVQYSGKDETRKAVKNAS